jgi:hypothetical protein
VVAYGPAFESFLDCVSTWLHKAPTQSSTLNNFDFNLIDNDIQRYNDICMSSGFNLLAAENLKLFIQEKQVVLTNNILTVDTVKGFEGFEKFDALAGIASRGVQPHFYSSFVPNCASEELTRPSYALYQRSIHHELSKLQRQGKCIILPAALLRGMQGLHTNAIHVVLKPGDEKVRVCTDAAASGLNEGTDMEEVLALTGEFNLPNMRDLASVLCVAAEEGRSLVYKTDVSSAFTTVRLPTSRDFHVTRPTVWRLYCYSPGVSIWMGGHLGVLQCCGWCNQLSPQRRSRQSRFTTLMGRCSCRPAH